MMMTVPFNIQYSQIETIFQMTHISASQQRRNVQLNFATASRTSGNCVIKMVSRFLFDAFRVDYFRVGHVSTDDSIKGSNKLILSFVLQKVGVWKSHWAIFFDKHYIWLHFLKEKMNPKWWANDLPWYAFSSSFEIILKEQIKRKRFSRNSCMKIRNFNALQLFSQRDLLLWAFLTLDLL